MTKAEWLEGVLFEEAVDSKEMGDDTYEYTTLYFIAPVSLREKLGFVVTPDMENTDISVEFPGFDVNLAEIDDCSVMIGYTVDGCTEDWDYIDCPYDVIEGLLDMYREVWNDCQR